MDSSPSRLERFQTARPFPDAFRRGSFHRSDETVAHLLVLMMPAEWPENEEELCPSNPVRYALQT